MPGLKSSRCLSSLLSPFSVILSTAHQIPKQLVDFFLLGLFLFLSEGWKCWTREPKGNLWIVLL